MWKYVKEFETVLIMWKCMRKSMGKYENMWIMWKYANNKKACGKYSVNYEKVFECTWKYESM